MHQGDHVVGDLDPDRRRQAGYRRAGGGHRAGVRHQRQRRDYGRAVADSTSAAFPTRRIRRRIGSTATSASSVQVVASRISGRPALHLSSDLELLGARGIIERRPARTSAISCAIVSRCRWACRSCASGLPPCRTQSRRRLGLCRSEADAGRLPQDGHAGPPADRGHRGRDSRLQSAGSARVGRAGRRRNHDGGRTGALLPGATAQSARSRTANRSGSRRRSKKRCGRARATTSIQSSSTSAIARWA